MRVRACVHRTCSRCVGSAFRAAGAVQRGELLDGRKLRGGRSDGSEPDVPAGAEHHRRPPDQQLPERSAPVVRATEAIALPPQQQHTWRTIVQRLLRRVSLHDWAVWSKRLPQHPDELEHDLGTSEIVCSGNCQHNCNWCRGTLLPY